MYVHTNQKTATKSIQSKRDFSKTPVCLQVLASIVLSHFVPGCLISVSQAWEKKCVALTPFQLSNQTYVQHAKGKGMCTVNMNVENAPPSPPPFPSMPKPPALRTEGFARCRCGHIRAVVLSSVRSSKLSLSTACSTAPTPATGTGPAFLTNFVASGI